MNLCCLKIRFGDSFIWILLDKKLGSDENQSGEVKNWWVGGCVLPPSRKWSFAQMLRLEHGDQRTPSRFYQHHPNWQEIPTFFWSFNQFFDYQHHPNWPEIVTIYHHRKKYGLVTRLESHAKGRLSGDQFNVYVANRFVVPSLTAEQQSQMSSGSLTLDILTRQFIHHYFQYQYLIVGQSKEAFAIKRLCQAGYIFNQKPYLNPIELSPTYKIIKSLKPY